MGWLWGLVVLVLGTTLGVFVSGLLWAAADHRPIPPWVDQLVVSLDQVPDNVALRLQCRSCEGLVRYDATSYFLAPYGGWDHVDPIHSRGHAPTPYLQAELRVDDGPQL